MTMSLNHQPFSSFHDLQLAVQLLDLAAMFVEHDTASPFQLCGIVIPKLVSVKNS